VADSKYSMLLIVICNNCSVKYKINDYLITNDWVCVQRKRERRNNVFEGQLLPFKYCTRFSTA